MNGKSGRGINDEMKDGFLACWRVGVLACWRVGVLACWRVKIIIFGNRKGVKVHL
jgi:hypothetical protein